MNELQNVQVEDPELKQNTIEDPEVPENFIVKKSSESLKSSKSLKTNEIET